MADFFKQVEQLFLYLDDTPNTYSGIDYIFLKVNEDKDGLIFGPVDFVDIGITSVSGHGGQYVYLNLTENKLDFKDIGFLNLYDTPTTYSGYEGQYLKVKADASGLEYTTLSGLTPFDEFIELTDTPSTYTSYGKDFVTVKEDESGLEFTNLFDIISGWLFFREFSDETTSSTTSTSWQEKVSFDIDDLPAGKYRIGWYYEWQYKHGSFEFECRIQIDNTTTIHEFFQEPENVNSWYTESGFKYVTLTEDDHTIDVDYCGTKSGKTAKIKAVRLEFWRVN